jgi:hypothetical protein
MSRTSRFVVLWRAFFAQFFTSDTVSADVQLRQTIVWVLAFLLVPGVVLMVQVFFEYQGIVARALRHQRFDILDDTIEWIVFVFVTYSMVTVGFVAVFVWDALTLDCRDAMVLGPLPVRGSTIVAAKLAALCTFLAGTALAMNLPNAFIFAFETANSLGFVTLIAHFVSLLTATVMAAVFVFAAVVVVRSTLALVAGPRLAAACGSLLQFLFVVALLCFVILCPAVWRVPHRELVNPTATGWLPTSWFLGLFERMRGSTRAYFMPQATRALVWTAGLVLAGIVTSIAGFRRQLQLGIAPAAATGIAGAARVRRWLASQAVSRDRVAQAMADFMLITIARNRAQQTPIAMNAAAGVAIVLAALTQVENIASLARPRTAVLWIPLVVAYWLTVGVRAAFFVPSELPAAWTFRANAPDAAPGYWAAVRAVMLAWVLPPILVLSIAVTLPLLGWNVAAWHTVLVALVTTALVEGAALTVGALPFTHAYEPGRARLRTRWWLYVAGTWAFAYWPARFELTRIAHPETLAPLLGCLVAGIAALESSGRRRGGRWRARPVEDWDDPLSAIRVLDIATSLNSEPETAR